MSAKCPTPDKTSYPTRWAACNAMKSIIRRTVIKAPTDAYRCRCGEWHLTTRARTRGRKR